MNSPYGLANLWQQGDFVTRSVALILLGMSILSWFVIAIKALQLMRLRRQALVAGDEFWHSKSLEQGMALLAPDRKENPFRALAEDGANAAAHHAHSKEDLHGALNVSEWITSCLRRSIENISGRMQSGLPVLASIGSTAPFVGLFGTVWGIYHALVGIGVAGQASIDKVAGPVGEALIMTAFGLVVAIPAVLGYNTLVRSNKAVLSKLTNFAHDLHAYFITGGRVGQPSNVSPLRRAGGE
ncbi:outer membrane transport energization protein ExbB [Noviherbaspirillum humi]|uniref:Biopolymer transport protein ExbB n=1 Tax=Noviherbaspirillum humi TaxID=1688639 RepID=A0A239J489_9BURK|nr:MotA/TolQ/ExbB proton channel family protein [Noviherbaspirillum humi]SNT00667.1 outer membrane transport energization protein ExbB [Noviherbaspirillum humi]